MAFDFPSSPTLGQTYTPVAGATYVWNGYAWNLSPAVGASLIAIKVITSTQSYTPPPGLAYAIVEIVGGGGGGGGAYASSGSLFSFGAGGGAGGYSRRLLTAAQIGASQTVTIGAAGNGGTATSSPTSGTAGGDTSFGTLVVAKGGGGGGAIGGSGLGAPGAGGSAAAGTGDIRGSGAPGGGGFNGSSSIYGPCNEGGSSFFGGGGALTTFPGDSLIGTNATNYGSGGSGGAAFNTTSRAGGNGSAGVCIVTEFAGSSSSGLTAVVPPQGRLTLQTLTPVMTTTQAAKTTIYYTPYVGNVIPINDGVNMTMTTFAELSVATTDTSKNPAAIGVSKCNDWFVWNDAGTIRISHGPDWTNDTTRSAGTALTNFNGIWVNNAAITNGPGAQRGTYVGTTRSDASSQLNWRIQANFASGTATATMLGVWNAYNRVDVGFTSIYDGADWNMNLQQYRNFGNMTHAGVFFVNGLDEDAATMTVRTATVGSTSGFSLMLGVAQDGSLAPIAVSHGTSSPTAGASVVGSLSARPGIGYRTWNMVEGSNTTGENVLVYHFRSTPSRTMSGLDFRFKM